jgi:hypothetical protein
MDIVEWELGRKEPIEELLDLPVIEGLTSLDRTLAGEAHRDSLVLIPGGAGQLRALGELCDHLPKGSFRIEVGVQIRHSSYNHCVTPEPLDLKPDRCKKALQILGCGILGLSQTDGEWKKELLCLPPTIIESLHDLFKENPLVRRMLIDKEKAVTDLGHDPGAMSLPEARTLSP